MRAVNNPGEFTPLGLWIRKYARNSHDGLSVTNLDYVLEDFVNKRLMLLEEKQRGGRLHKAQSRTFLVLDKMVRHASSSLHYDYWGMYLLVLAPGKVLPSEGMKLNGKKITSQQLKDHLDFRHRFCEPLTAQEFTAARA